MKPLNEVKNLREQIGEESRQAVLDTLIELQIKSLERLLETNGAHVKSPMAYNTCASLIEQLKYYAPAAFRETELNFENEQKKAVFGTPLYGNP
jgi:hypothetical protein